MGPLVADANIRGYVGKVDEMVDTVSDVFSAVESPFETRALEEKSQKAKTPKAPIGKSLKAKGSGPKVDKLVKSSKEAKDPDTSKIPITSKSAKAGKFEDDSKSAKAGKFEDGSKSAKAGKFKDKDAGPKLVKSSKEVFTKAGKFEDGSKSTK